MSDFTDENCNFLFIKKGKDGKLLDHIFIHLVDSDETNFLAYFTSYDNDKPSKLFKLEEIALPDNSLPRNEAIMSMDYKEEQTWMRMKIKGVLPSTWKMLFESIVEKQQKSLFGQQRPLTTKSLFQGNENEK